MPRPRHFRRIGCLPQSNYFKPRGIPLAVLQHVNLSFDEIEAVRLADLEGLYQQQRDNLLAFAGVLDERFGELAGQFQIPADIVHDLCELQGMDQNHPVYWQHQQQLTEVLRHRFYDVQAAVRQIMVETPRAGSLVENLNSRLRNYFFLRRYIGNG